MLYVPVIGLEVHAQLRTATKLFSNAPSTAPRLTVAPNANVALFDAAFPGTLPILNQECIALATKTAVSLNSAINLRSTFDRKHYFYPDLPHGYQITQHFNPFATGGYLDVTKHDGLDHNDPISRFRIQQIQIEQDSGKLIKPVFSNSNNHHQVHVDLNRAGIAVLEIVTEPDFNSSTQVISFLKKMQRLLWHINVSSPEMDDGAWRCDVNISVRPRDSGTNGVRTELKHISKFSLLKTAIDFEVKRQIKVLESGGVVEQETRGIDDTTGETVRLRGKEDAFDYRYLPEPDLPAIFITENYVDQVRATLPESLDSRRQRLEADYGLSPFHIGVLMDEPGAVEYYEELNKNEIPLTQCPISVSSFGSLIDLVDSGKISGLRGKNVLTIMFDNAMKNSNQLTALEIAKANDWLIETSGEGPAEALRNMIDDLLAKHPNLVAEIKDGKVRKLKFFSGQVMAMTKGKADPILVDQILKARIGITLLNKKEEPKKN
ncbi:B subunit of glutamyl-tRNA and/or aspartyl-tRNA amidotransferase [Obelidium mucronatum]|nr:B subunit of glutamyl-tRNA and/or aspartyl-tRNA amidotransferase [Obelidium mucronatum]